MDTSIRCDYAYILINTRDDDKLRAKSIFGEKITTNRDFESQEYCRSRLVNGYDVDWPRHSTHWLTRDISLDTPDHSLCATFHFRRSEIAENTRSNFSNPTCCDASWSVTFSYRTACDSRSDDDVTRRANHSARLIATSQPLVNSSILTCDSRNIK